MKRAITHGLLVLATAAALAGCQSGPRRGRGGTGGGEGTSTDGAGGPSTGGYVALTDQDLAPMDAWIRRRVWILGDDVEIVASKEYFVQNLSIAARIGAVQRKDDEGPNEARSVLTYVGDASTLDVTSAPRVMIGTGVTVTARRTLTLRFVRTTTPDLPVRIRIAANGKASMGSGDQVSRRESAIVVGAQLRRGADGVYRFEEQ